jgi:GNAT superfamily N-acetyltransferase
MNSFCRFLPDQQADAETESVAPTSEVVHNMPMQTVQIALVKPEETTLLYDMIRELAVYEKIPHEVSATPEDIHNLLFFEHPYAEAMIARYAGQPAGFAFYFFHVSTFAGKPVMYLEDLYVRPEHRKRGIGMALLRAVARVAQERGCPRMEWTVLNWNTPALEFYSRVGAKIREDWLLARLEGQGLRKLAGN